MSQQINLYNPIFLKQKKYFSAVAMLQSLALVLAGVAGLYAYAVWQIGALDRLLADSERQLTERRAQLVRITREFSVQGRNKQLEDEVIRTEAQLQRRQELMADFTTGVGGNAEGFSRYLTALAKQTVNGVWLTAITVSGKTNDLVLKGRVSSSDLMPAYVESLGKEPALAGRSVSALHLSTREGVAGTGAAGPAGAPAASAQLQPRDYVEFTLSIPLGGESTPAPVPQKGAS